jgi:4'-phosphopantetheinyl transferase
MTRLDPLSLPENEAHLWYVRTEALTDAALLAAFEAMLSDDERLAWQRFRFDEGRHIYLTSHGFLRCVLSRYAEVAPAAWVFQRNAWGKPELLIGPDSPHARLRSLCFNLTHTRGLAACVVAWDREVGVDAEDVERRQVGETLIHNCLSPEELASYLSLPEGVRQSGFFDYWTLKEAYLKARGFGLTLPVEEITFRWPSGTPHFGPVAVQFGPSIHDRPELWQFQRLELGMRHRIAAAVRRIACPDLRVVSHEARFRRSPAEHVTELLF